MRKSYAAIGFPFTTVLLLNISHLIGVFDLKEIAEEGLKCICYYEHIQAGPKINRLLALCWRVYVTVSNRQLSVEFL